MINPSAEKLQLLGVIKHLCIRGIRQPMTLEQVKAWLKQFQGEKEYYLGLLILRHLIFRTTKQLDSSLKQALKCAALHFAPSSVDRTAIDWRELLNGRAGKIRFVYGPPKQKAARPGKSGELISRQLKFCDPLSRFTLCYPSDVASLEADRIYLLIDDGTFTGAQLSEFLSNEGGHLARTGRCGIVVGMAHRNAIETLRDRHSEVPVFQGELVTDDECFAALSSNWVREGLWPFDDIEPMALYKSIVERARFSDRLPLGFGDLGCMVAYEHGIPDNSLQLLWDSSRDWNPLIPR